MSRATASGVTPTEAGIGSREWRVIIAILTGAAVLIAAYWMIWFVVDRSILASDTRDAYYELENVTIALSVGLLAWSWRRRGSLLAGR